MGNSASQNISDNNLAGIDNSLRSPFQYIGKIVLYALFISFTVFTIFPLIFLFYSSFKDQVEILKYPLALPRVWTVKNYIQAVKIGKLNLYALNSFIYTIVSTSFTIVFSMMVSFAFAKIKFRISKVLYNLFLIGLLISIHSILVPLYIMMIRAKLTDTHIGIILVYTAINLPMAIYIGTEFIKGIPDSIIESARIDGATYFEIFLKIILPICLPIVITIGILTVLACWNEFILVFILTSSDAARSLPVGIYKFSGPMATEYGMQFAALVIGTAPLLLFYALFYKKITEGVVAGAVKE